MIQPQELKRGNIIGRYFHNPNPKGATKEVAVGVVMEIREESVNMTAKLGRKERIKLPYESLTPIELTEEWLLNLGFRKSFRGKWEKDELAYDIYGGNGLYMHGVTPEIKYVHQLQNLYFSLTGQELTIKE